MNMSTVADVVGFLGAMTILAGFARQTAKNTAPDLFFHLANFFGAAMLAFSLIVNFNLPALLLEIAWAAIALFGIVRLNVRK